MYKFIKLELLIKIIVIPSLLIYLFFLWLIGPDEWLRSITLTLTSMLIICGILGNTSIWRWIWKHFPSLNEKVFPDINGVWRGQLLSNWPRIDASRKNEFVGDVTEIELMQIPLRINIKCNWFWIHMSMETGNNYSSSHTVLVNPCRGEEGKPHELHYIYDNRTPQPLVTDSTQHYGAAIVTIKDILTPEPRLEGQFWTNRNWTEALNTAGQITMRRETDNHKYSIMI